MYAHIDCNNFFASCERLFRPDLTDKPVAVLSNNDGCIIARSDEVKKLEIPMGAPLFKVQSIVRAHNVTLFSANFELYGDISQRLVDLLTEITPSIEVYSIDECFLDLSELHIADLSTWAKNVQKKVQKNIGIPVSIGIANTKTLAKVATNYAKKHEGTAIVDDEGMRRRILERLMVEDVWGIGRKTSTRLHGLGVMNAWQLASVGDSWLRQFSVTTKRTVDELRGVGCLMFGDKYEKRQSIMVSRAFGHKVRQYHQLESATANFATKAVAKLRAQGSVCAKVTVHLTTGRYGERVRSVSKSAHLAEATADTGRMIVTALELLGELYDPEFSYQKVAVGLVDIVDKNALQPSLVSPDEKRDERERLMSSVDELNKRYGSGTVWYAVEDKSGARWQSKQALRSPRYTTSWAELPSISRKI